MTEPLTFRDLSPELVEEFSPPCDVTAGAEDEPCREPAEWAVVMRCPECNRNTGLMLMCDAHKEALDGVWFCRGCGSNNVPSVTRLERL